jgi:hypothetical protein
MQPHGKIAEGQGAKQEFCFAQRFLDFHLFFNFCFCSWFYMMSFSM